MDCVSEAKHVMNLARSTNNLTRQSKLPLYIYVFVMQNILITKDQGQNHSGIKEFIAELQIKYSHKIPVNAFSFIQRSSVQSNMTVLLYYLQESAQVFISPFSGPVYIVVKALRQKQTVLFFLFVQRMEQYSPDCSRNIMAFWKSTAKQRSARGHSIKKVFEATKHVSVSQGRV